MTQVALPAERWNQVRSLFQSPLGSPAVERERIASALALLEQLVGALTGTAGDRGGTFRHLLEPGQLDCQDEARNTATYLALLAADGMLRWHEPGGMAHRGLFRGGGWPHSTAVMIERAEGRRFAVDTWFLDNGAPPYIIPLELWLAGWRPPSPELPAGNP